MFSDIVAGRRERNVETAPQREKETEVDAEFVDQQEGNAKAFSLEMEIEDRQCTVDTGWS